MSAKKGEKIEFIQLNLDKYIELRDNGKINENNLYFIMDYAVDKHEQPIAQLLKGTQLVGFSAREIADAVEYQTITSDAAYTHINLPAGDKTVTLDSDGAWGGTAYISTDGDLISRNTFNRKFPHDGITLTRDDMVYHVEGATGTSAVTVNFCETTSNTLIALDHVHRGRVLKLIGFTKYAHGLNVMCSVRFLDAAGKTLSFLNASGVSKTSEAIYVGKKNTEYSTTVTAPADAAYVSVNMTFPASATYDFDFQVYLFPDDATAVASTTEPNEIGNVTSAVVTAPYKSTVDTKAPIKEYIDYMVQNADGGAKSYLMPEHYGAIGDGYADDSAAISQCLSAAVEAKRPVLMTNKYLVTSPVVIAQDGLDITANEIVYTGTDTAIKISGQRNTLNVHSITSDGVGITYRGDNEKYVRHNDVTVNNIVSKAHGIVFRNGIMGIFQNTVKFNSITAGGSGFYGICELKEEGDSWVTENNFYGGQIANCEWAVYGICRNSKMYGVQIEGDVGGCFYVTEEGLQVFHPRITESQKDGHLAAYKFVDSANVHIYDSTGIYINQIDLSDGLDVYANAAGETFPLHEYKLGTINGRIIGRNLEDGEGSHRPVVYTDKAYVWGKYLIMTPFMAYRKVVTTAELDTRNIGKETSLAEIEALSQLPTKFVVNTVNATIRLHESYCAFGFNEFEVEQANGFTCTVYDRHDNLIFDGSALGDGTYKFKVYKDADKCMAQSHGLLRRDFLGHHWEVTKSSDTINGTAAMSGSFVELVAYGAEGMSLVSDDGDMNIHSEGNLFISTTGEAHIHGLADPENEWDAANKRYVDGLVGDIESALDSVIALQNSLIGGDA